MSSGEAASSDSRARAPGPAALGDAWFRGLGSSWRGGLAIIVLCLSVYLPGLWSIPPVDRDESRFAQASRQMHESGDWIVPRVQDKPRLNKPPLIYWLQNASIAAFGDEPGGRHGNIWVFRLPSMLCAIGAVLLTWRIGLRLMDARAAWLGAALLAVSPIVVWDAHQARADQLLLVCTTAAMLALLRVWQGADATTEEKPTRAATGLLWPLAFWLSISTGILAKGPITPMVAGLTVLTLGVISRRWRWMLRLRPLLGVVLVGVLVLPWVVAVAGRVGWSAYLQTIFDETLGRSAAPKEGHWGPPGYHLVLLTVLMWPGSLLTGWALLHDRDRPIAGTAGVIRRWFSDEPARLFLLAWAVPSWMVFELISTKLPHYTMPLYPALALLSARALVNIADGRRHISDVGTRIGFAIWWVVGLAATLGLSIAVLWAGRTGEVTLWRASRPYMLPGVLVTVFLLAAGRSVVRGALLRAQLQAMVAVTAWGATFLHLILPGAERLWVSPRIMTAVEAVAPAAPIVNRSSFHEDSLVFLSRGRIVRDAPVDTDLPAAVTLIDAAASQQPEASAVDKSGEVSAPKATTTRVQGLNYSTGKLVDVIIIPPSTPAPTVQP